MDEKAVIIQVLTYFKSIEAGRSEPIIPSQLLKFYLQIRRGPTILCSVNKVHSNQDRIHPTSMSSARLWCLRIIGGAPRLSSPLMTMCIREHVTALGLGKKEK